MKNKLDALEACSYVRKNNPFGKVEIACTCSAEEFGLQCSQTEPMRHHLEAWRPPRRQQPIIPPKSILKQPSDSVTQKMKLSATGKEKLRVKFRLPIDDSVLEQLSPPYSIRLSKPSNSSTFLHKKRPFPPPLPPQPPASFSYNMFESGQLPLLPILEIASYIAKMNRENSTEIILQRCKLLRPGQSYYSSSHVNKLPMHQSRT